MSSRYVPHTEWAFRLGVHWLKIRLESEAPPQVRRNLLLTVGRRLAALYEIDEPEFDDWVRQAPGSLNATLSRVGTILRRDDGDILNRMRYWQLKFQRSQRLDTPHGRLGFEIRTRRLNLGLTQAALARRAGTGRSHISRIEHGRERPSWRLLRRIFRALDIPRLGRVSEFPHICSQRDTG